MPIGYFLDTNVLIYAVSLKTEPRKAGLAVEMMTREDFGVSGQVLAEFYSKTTRGIKAVLTPRVATDWIDRLSRMPCADIDPPLVRAGMSLSQRYRISYWDGAIIAAAERLGAPILYTEDLNHGQLYGSVRVHNPFLNA